MRIELKNLSIFANLANNFEKRRRDCEIIYEA